MLRQFGLLLAVGVAAICLNSIMAPLAILGIREYKSPTKGRDFREGPLGRLVVWLGSIPKAAAMPIAVLSTVIFAGGILVEGKLTLQTDPIQWVNQKSQVIKDLQRHRSRDRLVERARRVRPGAERLRRQEGDHVPRPVHAQAAAGEQAHAPHGVGNRQHRERPHRRARRAARDADGRRGEGRVRRRARGHQAVDGVAARRAQRHLPHRPERARRAREGRARDPLDGAPAGRA